MPGRICKQRQQHGREQEVPQVVHRELELVTVLRLQLRARHDTCTPQARLGNTNPHPRLLELSVVLNGCVLAGRRGSQKQKVCLAANTECSIANTGSALRGSIAKVSAYSRPLTSCLLFGSTLSGARLHC